MSARGPREIVYEWRGSFDNAELNALHAEAFGHAVLDDDWNGQVHGHSLGWVCAREGGEVVGFVEIGAATYPEEVATEDTGELHFLFVAPDFLGSGIGSRLLAQATELFHEDGYRQAILWVFSRNLQARGFYESQGWSTNGVERPDPALSFLATPPLEVCYTLSLR